MSWPNKQRVEEFMHQIQRAFAAILATIAISTAASGEAPRETEVSSAYSRYLAAIEHARDSINSSAGVRPGHEVEDRREGALFMQSVINASVTWALLLTPDQPMMSLVPRPSDRLGLDNPDNLYYTARVSDTGAYVISGKRGSARTFLIQALSGLPGLSTDKGRTLSYITGRDLHLLPDGSFRITLSRDKPESGDWLPLRPGVDNLLVRVSYQDWQREQSRPTTISIAPTDGGESWPPKITPALATAMLDDAAVSIEQQAAFYSQAYAGALRMGVNRLVGPKAAGADQAEASNQWNLLGPFEISGDEAMVVTVKAADNADYHNFEVANPWMNTFEFVHHQSSLNRSQLRVDGDGSIRYVVSPVDPGVPNWIDTTGQTHGWIWSRWQDVDGELGPEFTPSIRIVKLATVRDVLPPDTPVVTPAERRRSLARRAELLRQRFNPADPMQGEMMRRLREIERLVGRPLEHLALGGPVVP